MEEETAEKFDCQSRKQLSLSVTSAENARVQQPAIATPASVVDSTQLCSAARVGEEIATTAETAVGGQGFGGRKVDSAVSLKCLKPKKAAYRQRAHCNPLSDSYIIYPRNPDFVDWSTHFPAFFNASHPQHQQQQQQALLCLNTDKHPISYSSRQSAALNGSKGPCVEFLDVGCGFGGLLVALSTEFPRTLIMGFEIREKVTNYVGERILALRQEHAETAAYQNVSVLRTNAMKFLPNYFRKGQLKKIFFCFPDPHFKRSNWRRRIINAPLVSLYAYILRPGGLLYTVTDVEGLHKWMRKSLLLHPLFKEIPLYNLREDPCISLIENCTEEGLKVKRQGHPCYTCVFRRIPDLPL